MKRTRLIVTAQTESVTKLKHAQQQRPLSRLCLSVLLFFSSGFAIRRFLGQILQETIHDSCRWTNSVKAMKWLTHYVL